MYNLIVNHWDEGDFKRLEKLWYDKLKDEGFKDIENTSDNKRMLKEWDLNFFRNKFNQIKYESTLQYYKRARQLLITYPFKNEHHKKIWELHCEGLTIREISSRIKIYKKTWVHRVISEVSARIKKD